MSGEGVKNQLKGNNGIALLSNRGVGEWIISDCMSLSFIASAFKSFYF